MFTTIDKSDAECDQLSSLELCHTCGDKSTGSHFGGMTCESCKSFFRRSVKENRWEEYKCLDSATCKVNKNTRKFCRYCRYQRCISIGMKPKWVLTDEERAKKYGKKNSFLITVTTENENKDENETPESMNEKYHKFGIFAIVEQKKFLTNYEKLLINNLVNEFYLTRKNNDLNTVRLNLEFLKLNIDSIPKANSDLPLLSQSSFEYLMIQPVKRVTSFVKQLPDFCNLDSEDQISLLRGSLIEVLICKTFIIFDQKTDTFQEIVSREHDFLNLRPLKDSYSYSLAKDNLIFRSIWSEELLEKTINFLKSINILIIDETTLILFIMLIFFSPDRPEIKNHKVIFEIQNKYSYLLFKYLGYKTNNKQHEVFTKLLLKLRELRDLQEVHRSMKLGNLNILQDSLFKFKNDPTNFKTTNLVNQIDIFQN